MPANASTTLAATAAPHNGVVARRAMPEASDLALAALAAAGLWLVRRVLRARFRRRRD